VQRRDQIIRCKRAEQEEGTSGIQTCTCQHVFFPGTRGKGVEKDAVRDVDVRLKAQNWLRSFLSLGGPWLGAKRQRR